MDGSDNLDDILKMLGISKQMSRMSQDEQKTYEETKVLFESIPMPILMKMVGKIVQYVYLLHKIVEIQSTIFGDMIHLAYHNAELEELVMSHSEDLGKLRKLCGAIRQEALFLRLIACIEQHPDGPSILEEMIENNQGDQGDQGNGPHRGVFFGAN